MSVTIGLTSSSVTEEPRHFKVTKSSFNGICFIRDSKPVTVDEVGLSFCSCEVRRARNESGKCRFEVGVADIFLPLRGCYIIAVLVIERRLLTVPPLASLALRILMSDIMSLYYRVWYSRQRSQRQKAESAGRGKDSYPIPLPHLPEPY